MFSDSTTVFQLCRCKPQSVPPTFPDNLLFEVFSFPANAQVVVKIANKFDFKNLSTGDNYAGKVLQAIAHVIATRLKITKHGFQTLTFPE